ncbi:MAG: PAS domain S-box protein [Ignavibacteria bacterium]|nr:PAS domain S-box protein [Ignavibacteria bacterium]
MQYSFLGKKSISFRLTLLAWLTIIVTIGLFTGAMIPFQQTMVTDRMSSEAEDIATSIGQVTATALITEDYSFTVEHCLRLLRDSKSILYIVITRKDGFSLVHTAREWRQDSLRGIWVDGSTRVDAAGKLLQSDLVGQQVFHFTAPFRYSGIDWGWIHIGLSLKKYHENMRSIYARTFVISIACIVFGFIVSVGFGRRLSRPIRELDESTRRIASGDLSSRARVTTGDELERLANSFNDMTGAWEKSRSELLHSRELTSNIVTSLNDMLVVINSDGSIRMINHATSRLAGYSEAELINQSIFLICDAADMRPKWDHILKHGTDHKIETTFRAKSGLLIPVLFSATVLSRDDRENHGLVCVAVDITQRKQYEEELKYAHDELEERVETRTAELALTNTSLLHEIQENDKAREQILSSLREKEVLLKEIHHRVKNNLQVISSLLNLQASSISDPQALEAFVESQQRVKTMGMIHEKLYQSKDLAHIEFADYVRNLASSLFRSYSTNGHGVRLEVEAENIYLDVETAIPCGLIINELITNSLKYAFRDGRDGIVRVCISREEKQMRLSIGDNGVGMPADFTFERADSLGLRLVKILTKQLRGELELTNGIGAMFHFTIPMRES